jgi:hypothetical protein
MCHEVVALKKQIKDRPAADRQHSVQELRQELRAMGYRLTGNEAYDDLVKLLKEELNRQWFQSASRGTVIRRRRKEPANSH